MDFLKKEKTLAALVVALALINIVTILFVLFMPLRPAPRPPRQGRNEVESFIDRELGFSDEQRVRYAALRAEHFNKGDSLMQVRSAVMKEMFGLLESNENNEQVSAKAVTLGRIESELAIGTYEHFRAVRALCTPAQQQKFDELITDVLMKMREPRGGPGPGAGPRPDEGPGPDPGRGPEPPEPPGR
jgi:hypothetical protein